MFQVCLWYWCLQIERWGNVEWHHDLDLFDTQARMAAAALFVHWSNETVKIKRKAMLQNSANVL